MEKNEKVLLRVETWKVPNVRGRVSRRSQIKRPRMSSKVVESRKGGGCPGNSVLWRREWGGH